MDISSIKLNGTAYEVKDAQARQAIGNINAVTAAWIPRIVTGTGSLIVPSVNSANLIFAPDCTSVGDYALAYALMGSTGLVKVNLSKVKSASNYAMQYAFYGCSNLVEVDFSGLENLPSSRAFYYAFAYCSKLKSVVFPRLGRATADYVFYYAFNYSGLTTAEFPALKYICGNSPFYGAFMNCASLTSVSFPELVSIGYKSAEAGAATVTGSGHFASAFANTPGVKTLSFPKLARIYSSGTSATSAVFYNCAKLEVINLPALSTLSGTGAKYLFNNCSALREIHFGAANETAIRASEGFSTLWGRGAGAATVYFDL